MIERKLAEPRIPGYQAGYKIDEKTGQKDKREYSHDLELAEDCLRQIQEIKKQIQEKETQAIPSTSIKCRDGREIAMSLHDLFNQLEHCEDLFNEYSDREDWDTNQQQMKYWKTKMLTLKRQIIATQEQLGIPGLARKISELQINIQKLIANDAIIGKALKHAPPESFKDNNI